MLEAIIMRVIAKFKITHMMSEEGETAREITSFSTDLSLRLTSTNPTIRSKINRPILIQNKILVKKVCGLSENKNAPEIIIQMMVKAPALITIRMLFILSLENGFLNNNIIAYIKIASKNPAPRICKLRISVFIFSSFPIYIETD